MREKYAFYTGRYWDENDDAVAESVALLVLDPGKGTLERHVAVRGEPNASYVQLLPDQDLMAIVSESGSDRFPHVSLYSFAQSLVSPELLAINRQVAAFHVMCSFRHPVTG